MPNWVYNRIDGFTPEMFEKYKGEGTDFDFNKLIPMPEELLDMPSGTYADEARDIHEYKITKSDSSDSFLYTTRLNSRFNKHIERVYNTAGQIALANPDKTMNQILDEFKASEPDHDNGSHVYYGSYKQQFADDVENLRTITGRYDCKTHNSVPHINDRNKETYPEKHEILDRYCEYLEKDYTKYREIQFKREKNNEKYVDKSVYQSDSLTDLGNKLAENKEKHGFDNWYDWRLANWGCKWDASDAEFDQGSNEMRFDTAWSVPEPILAKLQEENPDAKFHIYSEEETGWWNEYETKDDSKLHLVATGQYEYKENEDGDYEQVSDGRENKDIVMDYEKVRQDNIDETNRFNNYRFFDYR